MRLYLSLLLLFSFALPSFAQTTYFQNWDSYTPPAYPSEWVALTGSMSTVATSIAVSGNRYARAAANSIAVHNTLFFGDGTLDIAWFNAGGAANRPPIIIRAQDANNYYSAVMTSASVTFYKTVAGTKTTLGTVNCQVIGGTWAYVGIEMTGSVFKARLYNIGTTATQLAQIPYVTLSKTDSTFVSGKVGFASNGATAAVVDNFTIYSAAANAAPAGSFTLTPTVGSGQTGTVGTPFSVQPNGYLQAGDNMTISLSLNGNDGVFKDNANQAITSLTFTPAGSSIPSAQSFFYCPVTVGTKTLTVTGAYAPGITQPVDNVITYTAVATPLTLLNFNVTGAESGITVTGAAAGGSGVYTYYIHRLTSANGTFSGTAEGQGTCIGVSAGAALNHFRVPPATTTPYWVGVRLTDSDGAWLDSPSLVAVQPDPTVNILIIGDSYSICTIGGIVNTSYKSAPQYMADVLSCQLKGICTVNIVQAAVSGSLASDARWQPGGSYYNAALAAAGPPSQTPYVQLLWGRNDKDSTPAQFEAAIRGITTGLVNAGYTVKIHTPIYTMPSVTTPLQTENMRRFATESVPKVVASFAVSNPGRVSIGDTKAFALFASKQSLVSSDGVHPTSSGYSYLGFLWAASWRETLHPDQ